MIIPDGNGCIIAGAAGKRGLAFDVLQIKAMHIYIFKKKKLCIYIYICPVKLL
jgi:hypothetical protein